MITCDPFDTKDPNFGPYIGIKLISLGALRPEHVYTRGGWSKTLSKPVFAINVRSFGQRMQILSAIKLYENDTTD